MPEQRPDDLLAGAHDGVAAAGGVAGAVAGDVADAGLCGEVAIPAVQHLVRETLSQIATYATSFRYTRDQMPIPEAEPEV